MHGFANLTFAGGPDTVANTIAGSIGYLAQHPPAPEFLRADPSRIGNAGEEFFRGLSPLTHIGRVCPAETDVHGFTVKPGGRVSLCWASANDDAAAFDAPEEIPLDRKPNPHLAFGSGAHLCLGAALARLIARTLLRQLLRAHRKNLAAGGARTRRARGRILALGRIRVAEGRAARALAHSIRLRLRSATEPGRRQR